MGSKVGFDGELWIGGVASVSDADINESSEGKVGGDLDLFQPKTSTFSTRALI